MAIQLCPVDTANVHPRNILGSSSSFDRERLSPFGSLSSRCWETVVYITLSSGPGQPGGQPCQKGDAFQHSQNSARRSITPLCQNRGPAKDERETPRMRPRVSSQQRRRQQPQHAAPGAGLIHLSAASGPGLRGPTGMVEKGRHNQREVTADHAHSILSHLRCGAISR